MRTTHHSSQRLIPSANILALTVILLFSWCDRTFAQQWNTNGNDISNTNPGNVGIGTTTPANKLEISAPSPLLQMSDTTSSSSASKMTFGTIGGYSGFSANRNLATTTKFDPNKATAGYFLFVANGESHHWWGTTPTNNSEPIERMRLDKNGNLGIGTSTPGYKLSVNGQINASGGFCIAGDCKTAWSQVVGSGIPSVFGRTGAVVAATNDYTWAQINKATSSLADITTRNAGDLNAGIVPLARLGLNGTPSTSTFLRGDNTWATVPSSQWTSGTGNISYNAGNVGIGTATPGFLLDVAGGTNPFRVLDSSGREYFSTFTRTGPFATAAVVNIAGSRLIIDNTGPDGGNDTIVRRVVNSLIFKPSDHPSFPGAFAVTQVGGSYILYAGQHANGNVGIGTNTPAFKLDVVGEINATGLRINGTPISIGPSGPITWAQVDKSTSNFADITTRSAGDLNAGTVPVARLGTSGTASAATFLRGDNTWAAVPSSQWASGTNNISYNAGNVGVGTTSPSTKLDVAGTVRAGNADTNVGNHPTYPLNYSGFWRQGADYSLLTNGTDSFLNAPSSTGNIYFRAANSDKMVLQGSNGNVGIGTITPAHKLDVAGVISSSTGGFRFPDGTVQLTAASSSGSGTIASVFGRTGTIVAATNDYTWAQINKTSSSLSDIEIRSAGDLNAGTVPLARLGTSGTASASTFLRGDNTWAAVPSSQWTSGTSNISYNAGNVGVGTASPATKLHVVGDVTVTGNITAKYQDVAEWVESTQELPPGTLVVLDHTKANQVIASSQAYDTRVAGVISERPGIALGEAGDNKVLVATTGRVKLIVDASKGPIQIGDLLVTSKIPGVAMKSEAITVGGVKIHRPGTIIGKALEPLAKGTGEILVLLSLQ